MTRSDSDDKSVLLVHAYLDGELDPANALGIAQQMSTDPALAAESERVKALQRLIRERLPREEAPPRDFGRRSDGRIEALWRALASIAFGGLTRQHAQPSWRALAASIALTAMVTSSSTWFVVGSQPAIHDVADFARLRPHPRTDGGGTSRCGVIGSSYGKALVQWPYSKFATRC